MPRLFPALVLGYPKVKVLHGGITAWTAEGRPLTTAVKTPVMKTFPVDPKAGDIMIDAKAMLASLNNPSIVKLDVSDVDEWVGTSSSPYGKDFCPRKGRIPGARWLEWYRMMKPTGEGPRLKAPEEIMAECATVGVTPETPVYLYCFKGARASNTYLALKEAGVKDVRIYFGSWNAVVARPRAAHRGRPAVLGHEIGARSARCTCTGLSPPPSSSRRRECPKGTSGTRPGPIQASPCSDFVRLRALPVSMIRAESKRAG